MFLDGRMLIAEERKAEKQNKKFLISTKIIPLLQLQANDAVSIKNKVLGQR